MVAQTSNSLIAANVRWLAQEYQWRLLNESSWIDHALVVESNPADNRVARRACLTIYAEVLHEACQETTTRQRHEQAYRELYDYLWRLAYYKNPEMANEVAQLAIELVFRSFQDPTLAKCREPRAFLYFAQLKLKDARSRIKAQQAQEQALYFSLDQSANVEQFSDSSLTPEEQAMKQETSKERDQWLTTAIAYVVTETLCCLQDLWLKKRLQQQLQVIIFTFIDHLKDEEIAARLQTKRDALLPETKHKSNRIQSLRSRGLDALKSCLSQRFLEGVSHEYTTL